jgi:hypothetical protein
MLHCNYHRIRCGERDQEQHLVLSAPTAREPRVFKNKVMAAEIFDQEEQYGDGSIHDAFDPQSSHWLKVPCFGVSGTRFAVTAS